jgi:DNA-binding MarR family transcriptional regulator
MTIVRRKTTFSSIPVDELSGCTCFRLRKVTRRVTQIYDQQLQQTGLTGPQFSALAAIHRRPQCSVSELGVVLFADPSTLTRLLRPLERRKLIKVTTDPTDRRRRTVALTDPGRAAILAALPQWRQAQAHVTKLVGRNNIEALHTAVDRSIARLTD